MKILLTLSAANLLLGLALSAAVYCMGRHSRDLGRQLVFYTAEKVGRRGRGRHRLPYLYRVTVRFNGAVFSRLVTEEEYLGICDCQSGDMEVYIREFAHVLCSPDWQKYEFSLTKTDWRSRDRKRCVKLFLSIFVAWEAVLALIALQP